jgi:hypothetical protein
MYVRNFLDTFPVIQLLRNVPALQSLKVHHFVLKIPFWGPPMGQSVPAYNTAFLKQPTYHYPPVYHRSHKLSFP